MWHGFYVLFYHTISLIGIMDSINNQYVNHKHNQQRSKLGKEVVLFRNKT